MLRALPPLFVIRHGQTDWNHEGRFQGQTDIAMNATGHQQAEGNGRLLAEHSIDWTQWRFVSSPLSRTRKTMEIVRTGMGLPPEGFETDPRLMELTFGDWEGSTLAELGATVPEAVSARDADKWGYRQPNGESYEDGLVRVLAFLSELDGPAVLSTHGGIVRIMRHLFEKFEKSEAAHLSAPQDRVYAFDGQTGGYL